MNAHEFRLGNLLKEVRSGQIVEVIGLKKFPGDVNNKTEIEVSGNFEEGWQAQKIPLTKDHFKSHRLRFHLGVDMTGEYYMKGNLRIHLIDERFVFYFGPRPEEHIQIVYLHDIQNLYMDVNRCELCVKNLLP